MNFKAPAPLRCLPIALLSLLLVSACAPAPAGPSSALRQQFASLMEQQQQQAAQLTALQEQLAQLQQQLAGGQPLATPSEQLLTSSPTEPVTAKLPTYPNQEISELADSAATYLAAFSNLAAERYPAAESGFTAFLAEYPAHRYAANARYWLSSAQAAQGNIPAAMSNLRQIAIDQNGRHKAPAALVLLAQLYRQQEQPAAADDVLEQLRSSYPDSQEAQHFNQSVEPQ